MVTAVIAIGVALLIVFATVVGTSMDTERRRARWRRVAEQRRQSAEQRRALLPEYIADPDHDRPVHPGRHSG
ncbi:hypothetical protein [Pseudonocardia lacus]|jgi:hypothetical protein|uniref:hypothetical protein n=1 Tax=Pseudonocardia lacus TaxID=2835865 RepID=UPI001BDDAE69|nr:hypothetical protein [Pseudonocardia lacus]